MVRTPLKILIVRTLAVITLLAAWIWANTLDYNDYQEQERMYCQMIELNRTNPDLGWPHYNKTIICE